MMRATTVPQDVPASDPGDKTGSKALSVLLLPREGIPPIFYYEPALGPEKPDAPEDPEASITTARGLRARLRLLMEKLRHAEQNAPPWLRSPIKWLKTKLPADERLVMALRSTDLVQLYHPTHLPTDEATGAWQTFVERRFRSRAVLFGVYFLVLIPATALTVLPGPNILGLWVAYRLIAHGLALLGLYRCRRGSVALEPRQSAALDGPVVQDRREADRVQRAFHLHGLKGRLKRDRVLARLSVRRRRAGNDAAGGCPR